MSYSFEFEGIGTHWWIEIYSRVEESIEKRLKDIVTTFEADYSRFKDDSLIGQLNINKILKNPPKELIEILHSSLEFQKLSNNIFNIGIAHVLENIGYDKDYSLNIKEKKKKEVKDEFIEINDNEVKIRNEVKIDLGGIGKGWLIDKLVNFLKTEGIDSFYINGGGDIYATDENNKPIRFALENPFNTSESIGYIDIKDEAIGSSSTNRRAWVDKGTGKKLHHLINTKDTGNFNSKKAAVYTLAKSATLADVSSTILFLSDDFESMAKELEVEYLVVFEDGSYKKNDKYPGNLFTN